MMVVYIQTLHYLSLTSKNNANLEVRFRDIYPISLSGLDYNQQETDIQYLTASVTFAYKIYEFANVGASTVVKPHIILDIMI